MLRNVVSVCKSNLKNSVVLKTHPILAVNSYRTNSSSVQNVSEQDKINAKKAIVEVSEIIGKHHGMYHEPDYNSEEFIRKYIAFFNRKEIDSWEIRRAIQDFADFDFVPDPQISVAVLKACRRLNDFALAVRYLEMNKDKCGRKAKTWYPYIIGELRPTLDELGISTPEELGYDKPEFAVMDVDDIH